MSDKIPHFHLTVSGHGQYCIRTDAQISASPMAVRAVRALVCQNYTDHPDYRAKAEACPFLQGYSPRDGYVLVEFWTDDMEACRAYVTYLNRRLPSVVQNLLSFYKGMSEEEIRNFTGEM